ncbi:DUF4468 domain-containing protein [Taibaiella koreensis]|uniref:DUF4468 domain-containing protein n=1 Tax=Taibaiella koreensis TaxID=1268548 RepID=UPI0013C2B847|nr:DUF4468 domain-containing protein [Taibaiella koreensis]
MLKPLITLALLMCSLFSFAQETDYPTDPKTGKITFTKTVSVEVSKERLYKRAEQFILSQNFDRIENIRCKDKSNVKLKIVYKPITYSDPVDGVYTGNGFFNFEYRNKSRFVVTYNFKIAVSENSYTYKLTNFKVMEFVTVHQKRGRTKGSPEEGFASSSGFVEFSAGDVRKFDLEEFVERNRFEDDAFMAQIKQIKDELKNTLTGQI